MAFRSFLPATRCVPIYVWAGSGKGRGKGRGAGVLVAITICFFPPGIIHACNTGIIRDSRYDIHLHPALQAINRRATGTETIEMSL